MRLPTLTEIKSLFADRAQRQGQERGYRDLVSVGGSNSDWQLNSSGEDSDVWQNAYLLTARVRSLFRENPTFQKYRDLLWANIFGSDGIMLRMKVQETENRVVNTPDEKAALVAHERRINRLREWAAAKEGRSLTPAQQYRAFYLADALESRDLETVLRGKATIQIGAPDVYANQQIEAGWKEWQRGEFCDVRGRRSYNVIRQLRLISAVRDGDFFIRKIKDPRVNKFGFSLQMINAEWCDRFYNTVLPSGNVVRMGIEYQSNTWGIGKPVAFYFIKRQPQDWQFSVPGAFNFTGGSFHERVDAAEIIHYVRCVDADGTRPAPWVASVIPKARQLDQYELAEVIAAREEACKTGFYYSDVVPSGGIDVAPDPRTGIAKEVMAPGERRGLPWGVKYQQNDPTHPSGNFESFRKGMLRSQSAGMPGADYNTIANDLENINFSAGRLGRLDTNEMSKMIQQNDIEVAEIPTFESWLEMSLITGAIPLPLAKLKKFNKPLLQGRRWNQVDEVKAVTAAALRVANHFSSDPRECADEGVDFEEVILEQAEANMLKEQLGISTAKTVEKTPPMPLDTTEDDSGQSDGNEEDKPKPKKTDKKNGKAKASNGHRFEVPDLTEA
jgi:lambda family phage portal protein